MTAQSVLLLLLVSTASVALGQSYRARYDYIVEPRPLRLQFTGVKTGLAAEGTFENNTYAGSGQSSSYQNFFVGPDLSLGMQGSIYHPNFFSFSLYGDAAYGWSEYTSRSGSSSVHHQSMQARGSFQGSANIFPTKPLNGLLTASYGRSFREYDFFTLGTVETLGYGARANYRNPWVTVTSDYTHTDESTVDTITPSRSEQDAIVLNALNERNTGSSSLNYSFNRYASVNSAESIGHGLQLSDSESFGSRNQFGLGASVGVTHSESGSRSEDGLSASTTLGITHNIRLTSEYGVNYDLFSAQGFSSQSYAAHARVQHQLYESLFSSANANAGASDSTAGDVSGYARQFSATVAEFYTKRLGGSHHMQIDASASVAHSESKSTGRAVNEKHTFPRPPQTESFFLNLFNVDQASIVIYDANNQTIDPKYLEVRQVGQRTEIRRPQGSTIIEEGSTVRVDYNATPTPAGSYESYSQTVGIRFDLWRNRVGVYGRLTHLDNNAAAILNTMTSTAYTLGSDLNGRWWRVGAEYAQRQSNESADWSGRLYQNATFHPNSNSSLNIGLNESYSEDLNDNRHEENYSLTSNYHYTFFGELSTNVRAGMGLRRGNDVTQTLAIFQPDLTYVYGRTTFHLSYNFEYNLYQNNQERNKHSLLLRIGREF